MTSDWSPRLIVSDIDGTLIDSRDRVPQRVRAVIGRAVAAGAEVALATGRPHRWIHMVLEQLPVRPVCVTSNGAVLYDAGRDEVIATHTISPDTMARVLAAARRALEDVGGVSVAAERGGKNSRDIAEEIFVVGPGYLHTWSEQGFGEAAEDEVISVPAVKMILRNDFLSAPEMHARIAPLIDDAEAHLTYSMNEGLIEVAAPGVTKAYGVHTLTQLHGIDQRDTVAFGDMPNDIEMLRFAGYGVAMRNAHPGVIAAADVVTSSNDEGGVADVLEQWFPAQ
ncbi:HAD family hydrolase [Corynebacterium yudongzhengii]|uniref:HAD family phosphatase n=1 Tax=Corynebacterium yudongzhengii TaxID=2080740 RepID=A0A2U1T832_9CORY|nr:HAD family hydrolase [Corynebacterium yudongzhengii]AWB82791.1 HAD family hydrolase [Corynebacterium yudongzhengii]PWC02149.1 HAD family phosphatase [Corynebacterium yudongzhengii]